MSRTPEVIMFSTIQPVIFIALVFIGINFLIDCSYALIDPRVRTG